MRKAIVIIFGISVLAGLIENRVTISFNITAFAIFPSITVNDSSLYAVDINFEWSNIHSNGLPEEMYINKYCPEIINGVTVPASFSPPDSLNIHAMFLDGELQYRKSPQTVPVQFNPEAMTLTGGQEY